MSALDLLLLTPRAVLIAGAAIAGVPPLTAPNAIPPAYINFVSGATGAYNATLNSYDITITGGGGFTFNTNLVPTADNTYSVGSAANRVAGFNGGTFSTFHASGDANPSGKLGDGFLSFGAGGASAVDTRLLRGGANTLTLDDGAGGNGVTLNLGPGGGGTLNAGTINANVGAATASFVGTSISQTGTGAANAAAAGFTITTQAVNATNGSAGSLYANVPAPTGTGAEGYFAVSRGGTANTFAQLGAVPGTSGGYGGLWILSSGATTTNYVIQSDGFYGYFNAPHYNAYICSAGTAYHMFNSNGAMIGSATANFSGASGGIIGMANASVAASSAAGAGGSTLWGDTLGLHYVGASASFCDYMIAPVQQGTANTQQNKFRVYSGVARTTTNSAVTILTIPVSTSGSVATIAVTVSARDVSSGTVGDGFSQLVLFQYKNVGGTVTAAATNAVSMGKCNDTSMSSCTVTATISGTNVLVQVTGISAVTIDWTAEANVTIT